MIQFYLREFKKAGMLPDVLWEEIEDSSEMRRDVKMRILKNLGYTVELEDEEFEKVIIVEYYRNFK